MLGKSYQERRLTASEFLCEEQSLGVLTFDAERNLQVFAYDMTSAPLSPLAAHVLILSPSVLQTWRR
jgi:hypothetical protein